MKKPNTIKVALYLRSEPEDGMARGYLSVEDSLGVQEKVCRKYCKTHGIKINDKHIYRDVCLSGRTVTERSGLSELFHSAETENEFDIVVVSKLAVLSRKTDIMSNMLYRLAREGVGLHSIDESFILETGGGFVVKLERAMSSKSVVKTMK